MVANSYNICLNFQSIHKIPIGTLLGRVGVYVLWSAKFHGRQSTYLGQGRLIARLLAHLERFGPTISHGAVAIIDGPPQRREDKCFIAESALLLAAHAAGRFPRHNKNVGAYRAKLARLRTRYDIICLEIAGEDPLNGLERDRKHWVKIDLGTIGDRGSWPASVTHSWERRRWRIRTAPGHRP